MTIGFSEPDLSDPRRERPTIGISFEAIYPIETFPEAVSSITFLMELFNVFILTSENLFGVAEWLGQMGGWNCRVDMEAARQDRKRDGWHDPEWLLVTDMMLPAIALAGPQMVSFTSWASALGTIGKLAGPEIMAQAGAAVERAAANPPGPDGMATNLPDGISPMSPPPGGRTSFLGAIDRGHGHFYLASCLTCWPRDLIRPFRRETDRDLWAYDHGSRFSGHTISKGEEDR